MRCSRPRHMSTEYCSGTPLMTRTHGRDMHIYIEGCQFPAFSLARLFTFDFPGYWIVRVSLSFDRY